MHKSLDYLNSKMWYRFVKVIFIFLFIGILAVVNILVFEEPLKSIDKNKSLIICSAGDKRVIKAKDSSAYLNNYVLRNGFNYKDYFEGYNEIAIEKILEDCYDELPTRDVFIVQRVYEIVGFKGNKREYKEDYLLSQINEMEKKVLASQKTEYLDYSIQLFDINLHFTYWRFIGIFLLSNIAVIAIFEILKRSFYYIVLGTLRPKKNQKGQS